MAASETLTDNKCIEATMVSILSREKILNGYALRACLPVTFEIHL